jgi:Lysyl oxidase
LKKGSALLAVMVTALLAGSGSAVAATPESGTLSSPGQPGVTWKGEHFSGAVSPPVPDACGVSDCDEFRLEVALPADVWSRPGGVQIGIRWADEQQDLDLFVYGPDGKLAAKSDGFFASTAESVLIRSARNGTYRVVVVPRFAQDLSYEGLAEVEWLPAVDPVRDLLPNLVVLPPRNLHFATGAYLFDPGTPTDQASSCYPEEMLGEPSEVTIGGVTVVVGGQNARRCLRFDQIIANAGAGPFELRYRMEGLATNQELQQRVYRSDGSHYDRFADTYVFHPAHAHFHYKNFAQSRLWLSDENGRRLGTSPVRVGKKNGFCMIDVENFWFGRKGDAARTYYFPRCNTPTERDSTGTFMVNGISVGWADVYNWYLADQFIEVSGLPDGYYLLETVADPKNTILESKETDNKNRVLIRLCGDRAEIVGQGSICGA